jgi:hypothetical protein
VGPTKDFTREGDHLRRFTTLNSLPRVLRNPLRQPSHPEPLAGREDIMTDTNKRRAIAADATGIVPLEPPFRQACHENEEAALQRGGGITSEFLGTWAVAADQGQDSHEPFVVSLSPAERRGECRAQAGG